MSQPKNPIAVCTVTTNKPSYYKGHSCMKFDGYHIGLYSKQEKEHAKNKYKIGDKYDGYIITQVLIHDDINIGQF